MQISNARPQLGLIGLGLVGGALVERFSVAGFKLLGFDIDPDRRRAASELGAAIASNVREIAACPRIVLSLPDSTIAAGVLGQLAGELAAGSIVVDTSTGDPADAQRMAALLAERDATYLDATISGSSAQVRQADVLVMAGGPQAAFDACRDIWDAFAKTALHVGPVGSGAKMKLVTNLVLGLNRAALAEGLALARSLGLDLAQSLAVLAASTAYSKIMDTKGPKMVAGDFSPQARLAQHAKDVQLMLAAGDRAGLTLPLSQAHFALLEVAQAAGWGELDNSALVRVYDLLLENPGGGHKQP